MRRVSCSEIDVETYLVLHEAEADHFAGADEVICLTHRENRKISKGRQRKVLALPLVNEKHVATVGGLGDMNMSDANGSRSDLLALNGVLQFVVERVVFHGAQDERTVAAVKGVVGPIHKLREMI